MRSCIVAVALVVAILVPCFGPLSSLVGALLCCSISAFLPSLLYLKVRWHTLSKCTIALNIIILVFAVAAAVGGRYAFVRCSFARLCVRVFVRALVRA